MIKYTTALTHMIQQSIFIFRKYYEKITDSTKYNKWCILFT